MAMICISVFGYQLSTIELIFIIVILKVAFNIFRKETLNDILKYIQSGNGSGFKSFVFYLQFLPLISNNLIQLEYLKYLHLLPTRKPKGFLHSSCSHLPFSCRLLK